MYSNTQTHTSHKSTPFNARAMQGGRNCMTLQVLDNSGERLTAQGRGTRRDQQNRQRRDMQGGEALI
jgi:hypothetical protein